MDLNKENDFYDTLDEETEKVLNNFLKKYDLTEEEKEQKRKEAAIELEKNGFLPINSELNETMYSPQESVETNSKKYIIEECIPACKELWSKNIYTFMVSDHDNKGECWIEIILENLSDENKEIYTQLSDKNIIKFSYHEGTVNFGVNLVGKDGQRKLLELAKQFKMQDVPKNEAYISLEEFLINYCNCYDEAPNPDYFYMDSPTKLDGDTVTIYAKSYDDLEKYNRWKNSIHSKKTIKKLNRNKITKPIDELVKEHGMILDDDRVYLSQFHYNKHLNYLNWLENENTNESIIRHK